MLKSRRNFQVTRRSEGRGHFANMARTPNAVTGSGVLRLDTPRPGYFWIIRQISVKVDPTVLVASFGVLIGDALESGNLDWQFDESFSGPPQANLLERPIEVMAHENLSIRYDIGASTSMVTASYRAIEFSI